MLAKRNRSVEGSCWACKDRRVACDLTKPRCHRCDQAHRECSYDPVRYRWRQGKSHIPRKSRTKTAESILPVLDTQSTERHLRYFSRELTPRLKVSNLVGPMDISALYANESFRAVIIATSCTHQSMSLATCKPSRVQSIEAQQAAIMALRKSASSDLSQASLRHFFQASTLLGVLYGMMDPCRDGISIRSHFEATKAILDRLDGPRQSLQSEPPDWTFFLSIFATMELVNAMLTGHTPLFGPEIWSEFGSCFCWWGTLSSSDPFLEAMALLSQLAGVGSSIYRNDSPIEIGALLAMHSAVQEPRKPKDKSRTAADDPAVEWQVFCAVYRNAASLYLYRAIARLPLGHPLVRLAVTDTLDMVEELPRHSRSCILLPLLILGLNCANDEEMSRMRSFIGGIQGHLFFGAVTTLQDCLEKHWRTSNSPNSNRLAQCLDLWTSLTDIADSVCLF